MWTGLNIPLSGLFSCIEVLAHQAFVYTPPLPYIETMNMVGVRHCACMCINFCVVLHTTCTYPSKNQSNADMHLSWHSLSKTRRWQRHNVIFVLVTSSKPAHSIPHHRLVKLPPTPFSCPFIISPSALMLLASIGEGRGLLVAHVCKAKVSHCIFSTFYFSCSTIFVSFMYWSIRCRGTPRCISS